MMKYLIYFIIGLFLFFGLKNFSIANEGNIASENNNNESVEGSSGLTHILSGNSIMTGELFTGFVDSDPHTTLDFGDLEIEEVFPGSGNCLDEYIIIVAHKDFSGYIDILGAGMGSGFITVWLNVYSGEQIIITDNVAGMKTTKQIVLLPSITLTNGGEILQLWNSGFMIDDILYSDPHLPRSLLYTVSELGKRYFKTVKDSQLQTYCANPELIISPSPIIGGCSIQIEDSQNNGSGNYTLSLTVSSLSGCTEGALNKRYNGLIEADVNVCQTSMIVGPGVHRLQYYGYSETGTLICSDELYFASQYDVGYIQIQNNSPGQCQSSQKQSSQFAQPMVIYDSKNCGIELQSPKIGFTVNNALNVRVLMDGTGLSNSQNKYSCVVDFGNGEKVDQCNPSSFHYTLAGIYTIGIYIKDNRTGQMICSHTSFLYVPSSLHIKDSNYSDIVASKDKISIDSGFYCSGVLSRLYVESLLPNPKGSDSLQEEIILHQGLTGESISQYILRIGKKSFNVSGELIGQKIILKNTFGLINKGMCFDLLDKDCGLVQHICYGNVKENELLNCPYGTDVVCIISGNLSNIKNSPSRDNACIEKINKLKQDHKFTIVSLREKQKIALLKMRSDTKQLVQKYKDKERISRNIRYVRERSFQIVYSTLSHGEIPTMLFVKDIQNVNNYLITYLENKYYILFQYEKTKIYMYDIKKFIAKFITQDSILFYFLPDFYFDIVNYQISVENS